MALSQGNYDSLLTSADSLSIFQLIDSLISNIEPEKEKSQIAVRAGYNSNITATGRPFELGQFGVSTGTAFYHKTGLFADVSGYWSNQYDPSYFLTVASIGYIHSKLEKWSFMTEYSRYLYHLSDNYTTVSYTNNFMLTSFFEHKHLSLRFDYSLYTGKKTGHRFNPIISINLEKKNWQGVKKISLYPSFSLLLGIEQVQSYLPLFRNRLEAIYRIRHGLPLFSKLISNEFGAMNYAFSAPLNISLKNWGFIVNYTYNIPHRLPGEVTNLSNGGYLSFSMIRYINNIGR